ncbi:MAG: hypothetical protein ABIP89_07205 [Polyangiaceae bacterium]
MKRTGSMMLLLISLGAGCGLDTAGLGDPSNQPGSTGTQHADAGANIDRGDASAPALAGDAAADATAAVDAAPPALSGCVAASCTGGDVCCVQDLGSGKFGTSCAASCGGGSAVVCDPSGAACSDGVCSMSGKFPGFRVCD